MLVLNPSLLNKEYILINVLKALASIISMCNLHVTLLSKITPRYFVLFTLLEPESLALIDPRGGLLRKHVHCRVLLYALPSNGLCLRGKVFIEPLPGNESICYNMSKQVVPIVTTGL
jgi:hypothetical protein